MCAFLFLVAFSLCGGASAGLRLRDYNKRLTGYSSNNYYARKRARQEGNEMEIPADRTARWRQHAIEAQFGQKQAKVLLQEQFVEEEDSASGLLDRVAGRFSWRAKGETMARYKQTSENDERNYLHGLNGLRLTDKLKLEKLQKEQRQKRQEATRLKAEREAQQNSLKEEQELQKQKSKSLTVKEEQKLQKKQKKEKETKKNSLVDDSEFTRGFMANKYEGNPLNVMNKYNKKTSRSDKEKAYRKHIKTRSLYPKARKAYIPHTTGIESSVI